MGILNVTPDSFYGASRFPDARRAVERAYRIREEGADMIDVGGESTRPGSAPVPAAEEIDRICPVIERIAKDIGIPISVDTYKSAVAEAALSAGATIVNDISGMTFDAEMLGVAARRGAGVVLMHIKGTPENMQEDPRYDDLIGEVCRFLGEAARRAEAGGVDRGRIVIDPGIGFGKSVKDNYVILNNIAALKKLGYPVLVGLSRKSLIARLYDDDSDRLPATIALNSAAVLAGADIIRVHDVKEHRLALAGLEMLKRVS